MIDVTLTVNKANVYDEVAKTTSYTGAKMEGDERAYERIFTTDDDRLMLERFWVEACDGATEQLKPFIAELSSNTVGTTVDLTKNYQVKLSMSNSYDSSLNGSVGTSLYSYFVSMIVSRWYKMTNKSESESYGKDAAAALDDVMRKLYYRKKPTRVAPTTT